MNPRFRFPIVLGNYRGSLLRKRRGEGRALRALVFLFFTKTRTTLGLERIIHKDDENHI